MPNRKRHSELSCSFSNIYNRIPQSRLGHKISFFGSSNAAQLLNVPWMRCLSIRRRLHRPLCRELPQQILRRGSPTLCSLQPLDYNALRVAPVSLCRYHQAGSTPSYLGMVSSSRGCVWHTSTRPLTASRILLQPLFFRDSQPDFTNKIHVADLIFTMTLV